MTVNSVPPNRRVTLKDVAERAQVSQATVSRVLNNHPHVDAVTREAVWRAAETLDYPLENLRRSTPENFSVTIVTREHNLQVVSETIFSAGIDRLMSNGAQAMLSRYDVDTCTQRIPLTRATAQHLVDDPSVDGLILMGGVIDHDFVRTLQESEMPFVISGAHVRPLQVNCIMANVIQGMEQAVRHLAESGRRRIGLVNGPPTTKTSEEKYKGLRLGLTLCDLPFDPKQVIATDFSSDEGYKQTIELLAQEPDLDAVIYADDIVAMGGISALKETGRRIPEDIAVIGYHDYDIARFIDPPLTSVHFDMPLMGKMAARRLLIMLEEPDDQNWFMLVPTELIVRGST